MRADEVSTPAELLELAATVDDMSWTDIQNLKPKLARMAADLSQELRSYEEEIEGRWESPAMISKEFEAFAAVSGALVGLATGAHVRGKLLVYEELQEENLKAGSVKGARNQQHNQGDRERISKGRNASFEGLASQIKEIHEVIKTKIFRGRSGGSSGSVRV